MKKKTVYILIPVLILVIAFGGWFILHEKTQNQNITALIDKVDALSQSVQELSSRDNREDKKAVEWGDGFKWMAIGNSLTWIESWGRGICSTQPDNDYFGIVKAWLEERYDTVQSNRYNFSDWERSTLRSTMYDLIDPYLSEDLNLVTIQLGENVAYLDTYEADLTQLINYVKKKCPNARVILIDDFWYQETSDIRRAVAEQTKTDFVDLSEIRGKKEYQSLEGTVYYLPDGNTGTVEKNSETHPGDAGMAFIADQLIHVIE